MNELFKAFDPVSAKAWKQLIQYDLKGAEYNEALVRTTPDGLHVQPFYHSDELPELPLVNRETDSFRIAQHLEFEPAENLNSQLHQAAKSGVQTVIISVNSAEDFDFQGLSENLLKLNLDAHLKMEGLDDRLLKAISEVSWSKNLFLNIDILGHLARTGNWYLNNQKDHDLLIYAQERCNSVKGHFGIDMALFQNAGANRIQQLAYGLSQAAEYLNFLESRSLQTFVFKVALDSDYFMEIAKLRALRWLWQNLRQVYNNLPQCHILAFPSRRNKTIYDYNVNMLRTTTECMSGIAGGADSICNLPYDALYHKPNEFGNRIAKNQLLIMKHESHLGSVNNPADGSYFIETMTHQLGSKALDLFKQLESNGGFFAQLKEGTIQRKISESAEKELSLLQQGELNLVGTTKYQNEDDRMKHDMELQPFLQKQKRKTVIQPILERRLAEASDLKRLESE